MKFVTPIHPLPMCCGRTMRRRLFTLTGECLKCGKTATIQVKEIPAPPKRPWRLKDRLQAGGE